MKYKEGQIVALTAEMVRIDLDDSIFGVSEKRPRYYVISDGSKYRKSIQCEAWYASTLKDAKEHQRCFHPNYQEIVINDLED